MALPGSGQISIDDLRTEFSATGTRGLSDFYRGGAFVPNTPANSGVPTAGVISLTDFYGAEAGAADAPAFSVRKTSNTSRTSTTLTADPHLSIASIPAGTYILEGYWSIQSASTSSPGGFSFEFSSLPTLSSSTIQVFGSGEKTANPNITDVQGSVGSIMTQTFTGLESTNSVAVTNQVGYMVRGSFVSTGSGTLTLAWGQDTSQPGNATTMLANSWIKLWEA